MDQPELEMIVLTTCPLWQARMIEGFLEDSGIPVLVSEGYPGGALSIVQVPAGRLLEAQQALEDAENCSPGAAE
jgi:hypothetical protein